MSCQLDIANMAAGNPGSKMREVWALPGSLLAVTTVDRSTAKAAAQSEPYTRWMVSAVKSSRSLLVPQTDSGWIGTRMGDRQVG